MPRGNKKHFGYTENNRKTREYLYLTVVREKLWCGKITGKVETELSRFSHLEQTEFAATWMQWSLRATPPPLPIQHRRTITRMLMAKGTLR